MSNSNDFIIENGVLKKYTGPGGDVVIPEGVERISFDAFRNCSTLTSVTIPDGVTSIGDWAFSGCSALTSVTIPAGVTSIGDGAFRDCSALETVTIPDSVTSIGDSAFRDCSALKSMTIPEGVKSIGDSAFRDCSALKSVTIPEGVTHIGDSAFRGCSALKSVTIPDTMTSIGDWAFSGCSALKSVTIPEGVTSIGDWAFSFCRALKSVVIPDGVTHIGDSAFRDCSALKRLTVPQNLKSLGKDPFGRNLPSGLIGELGSFYHALTDGSLKSCVLVGSVWKKLPEPLREEIYLSRQGKSLTAAYQKCMNDAMAEHIRQALLNRMSGKASAKECNVVGTFLVSQFEKVPAEQLKELYARLKAEKNGAKALKTVEEHVALMEKLGAAVEADDDLPPLEKKVSELLIAEKRSRKDLESSLKEFYSLTFRDLPPLKAADGHAAEPFVLAWLLTAHERLQKHNWGAPDVEAAYEQPGLRPEAAEVVALADPKSLQKALHALAEDNLGIVGRSKKMFLAFPICRYADESLMAELTAKAPKWRSSVSGNDAPPLESFRSANLWSDTRAAMLFAERYRELDQYARIRGVTADELRDQNLSDVGLDERGGKAYDLGNQTVTARLQRDLTFLFELPSGKTAKSLPKKGADEAKYTTAKVDFDEMRKSVKKILKSRGAVLFQDFLSGRRRGSAEWQAAYLKNPLLRMAGGQIVWAQGKKTFTLTDDGAVDSALAAYAITDQPIRVAHPMEMQAEDVTAWQKYFSSRALKQPFAQVWEPVIDPQTIREDRYDGSVQPMYRFTGKDKHGIHGGNLSAFSEDIGFVLDDCELEYEASTWRVGWDASDAYYTLGEFTFRKYTRKVNHIVSLLDRWTVEDRVRKDDVSVMDLMDGFTLAQITEFIQAAQEANAINVLAALLEYKNTRFADFDPMEEFTLEW